MAHLNKVDFYVYHHHNIYPYVNHFALELNLNCVCGFQEGIVVVKIRNRQCEDRTQYDYS